MSYVHVRVWKFIQLIIKSESEILITPFHHISRRCGGKRQRLNLRIYLMLDKLGMLVMLIGFPLGFLYTILMGMLGKLPGESWGPIAFALEASFRCGLITIVAVILVIAGICLL
jgi:hypothetical protein